MFFSFAVDNFPHIRREKTVIWPEEKAKALPALWSEVELERIESGEICRVWIEAVDISEKVNKAEAELLAKKLQDGMQLVPIMILSYSSKMVRKKRRRGSLDENNFISRGFYNGRGP